MSHLPFKINDNAQFTRPSHIIDADQEGGAQEHDEMPASLLIGFGLVAGLIIAGVVMIIAHLVL